MEGAPQDSLWRQRVLSPGRAWPSDGRGQPHCVLNLPAFSFAIVGAMLTQLIVGSREVQGGDS